jgi:hypothetical protein
MQADAIAGVTIFSEHSGLQLNQSKCAAIDLGRSVSDATEQVTSQDGTAQVGNHIEAVDSCRYLGHVAGRASTVSTSWTKAFPALTICLRLAIAKTNTAA